jgi:DNA processing protein
VYPSDNEDLFAAVERTPTSRLVAPFPDGTPMGELTPRARNEVLVGLAEAVVVVQAAQRSGTLNAMRWARELGRQVFVVPGSPWDPAFSGSTEALANGAIPVWSIAGLFEALGLEPPDLEDPEGRKCDILPPPPRRRRRPIRRQTYTDPPLSAPDPASWSKDETTVFLYLSAAPVHRDDVVRRTGLPPGAAITALLTLSLKDVVVEGPDGFFRRRTAV